MTNSENLKEIAALLDEAVAEGQLGYLKEMFLLTALFTLAAMAVFFILQAIGLYTINKRLGNKGAGLAFLPGFSGYALGAAADGLKKRKPSNYAVHMLMFELFYTVSTVVYYVYFVGRLIWFFEALENGHPMDTLSLLKVVESHEGADDLFLVSYSAVYFLNYAVSFVSLLCYARILQLFRSRGAFFLLIASVTVPQVMSVYLFVMRRKELYPNPPVFRFPGTDGDGADESSDASEPFDDREDDFRADPFGDIPEDADDAPIDDAPIDDASDDDASDEDGIPDADGEEPDEDDGTDSVP